MQTITNNTIALKNKTSLRFTPEAIAKIKAMPVTEYTHQELQFGKYTVANAGTYYEVSLYNKSMARVLPVAQFKF